MRRGGPCPQEADGVLGDRLSSELWLFSRELLVGEDVARDHLPGSQV
jgi:hypothetical protein